jgi:heme O synthase-like polyprenyltransferase
VPIDDKDLLQTNATVIAGILILFTFVSFLKEDTPESFYKYYVLVTIAAFASSSIQLILHTDSEKKTYQRYVKSAKYMTIIGFLMLLLTFVFLYYN